MFVIGGVIRFIIGPDDRNFNDGDRFLLKARDYKEISGLSEG
jgi:branched-chain amino acid transport system permease protein